MRAANNSNANRVTMVRGLAEDVVRATGEISASLTTNYVSVAIGVDSATVPSGIIPSYFNGGGTGITVPLVARYTDTPGIGVHYFQLLEHASNVAASVWLGSLSTNTPNQSGLSVEFKY